MKSLKSKETFLKLTYYFKIYISDRNKFHNQKTVVFLFEITDDQ